MNLSQKYFCFEAPNGGFGTVFAERNVGYFTTT
jgi:hypothetical protein